MAGEGRFAYQSPQSQAALGMNERGVTCPSQTSLETVGPLFLHTASAQLMFTDEIDEFLKINLCCSMFLMGYAMELSY